jgi:hypothetical protein
MPQNIKGGHVSAFDKYIYTQKQDRCKYKKFGRVSVNHLHLHWVYTGYWHLHAHNTGSNFEPAFLLLAIYNQKGILKK